MSASFFFKFHPNYAGVCHYSGRPINGS